MILTILARPTKISVIVGLTMYVSCVILGWRPQFYQNVRKWICRHRGFQSELRADFLRIGKLRPRSFRCMWFHPAIRNIALRNRKTLSCNRKLKHAIGHRLPKNAFAIAVEALFLVRKIVKTIHTKVYLYRCFQGEFRADL